MAWTLALAHGLSGCGSSAGAESGSSAASFEGPNFYESEDESLAPIPDSLQGNAPDFYELVSSDEPGAACAAGPRPSQSERVVDPALVCPRVVREAISDFGFVPGLNSANVTFGSESSVLGGTYFYPDSPRALRSDVTGNDWHLSGSVRDISGFGIYFDGCKRLDASAFSGIAFDLWGTIGSGGGLVVFVGTATNQIADEWLNANKADPTQPDEPSNLGRCVPVSSRYDGTCREPLTTLAVTPMVSQVRLEWEDFMSGCPAVTVDPTEITSIAWYFPQSAAGAYAVDIHIDNLRFADVGLR
jgi:hypothetical protein